MWWATRGTHEEGPSPDHQVTEGKVRGQVEHDGFELASRGVVEFLEVENLEDLLRPEPGSDGKRTDESQQESHVVSAHDRGIWL